MEPIREIDEDLWTVDLPHSLLGIRLGARSTIVRLPSGGLLICSPGAFGEDHLRAIRSLGKVEALVAPNTFHHLSLGRAKEQFSEAAVFLAPGLKEKVPGLPEGVVLGDAPPSLWSSTLAQRRVQGTTTNEVVFFHEATRTLLLTDLAFNIRTGGLWTRIGMSLNGGFGRFGPTRVMRSTIRDPAAFLLSLEKVSAWDFDRIVVAHGDILETGGREALRQAFGLTAPRRSGALASEAQASLG